MIGIISHKERYRQEKYKDKAYEKQIRKEMQADANECALKEKYLTEIDYGNN